MAPQLRLRLAWRLETPLGCRGAVRAAPMAIGCAGKSSEQRVRIERLGFEFGMELAAEEPGMVRRLDNFYVQVPSGVRPEMRNPAVTSFS